MTRSLSIIIVAAALSGASSLAAIAIHMTRAPTTCTPSDADAAWREYLGPPGNYQTDGHPTIKLFP